MAAIPPSMQILRTFRIAIAATGEYTEFHGGTVEGASSAIKAIIDRVNEIYQAELGVTLQLVDNNDSLIFTDKLSDPFSENAATMTTLQECQNTLDQVVGNDSYDLGMVFNTGQFGLAFSGGVCQPDIKGSACMGLSEPIGEKFAILVAHEIAHQFGANHSFNSQMGLALGRNHPSTAVEPGSGSTLMSYAGLCGTDSLQENMDGYFHAINLEEIYSFLNSPSGNCATFSLKSNSLPIISTNAEVTIPVSTPFVLTANASDPDGDNLLYSWEEIDIGPPQALTEADNGFSPLFRSFPPTTNVSRTFPQVTDILSNRQTLGEQMPSTNRQMNFRLVVRDNAHTGAFAWADTRVNVTNIAGQFRVTSQDTPATLRGGQLVTWNVAGTTQSPINVSKVNILLSTNGGLIFNTILATNVPNDGSGSVLLPSIVSTNSRIKVEAVDNIFFAVNDVTFSIAPNQGNHAPILDPTRSPTLNAVTEDAGFPSGNVGTLISSLVDFAVPAGQVDNVMDSDNNALLGIAITAADTNFGSWFYSMNGSTWTLFGAVSTTNSLLLKADSNNRIYFRPNTNFNGVITNALTFRAWDRTDGNDGSFASTALNGGSTPFSSETETANLLVKPVNDSPILDPAKKPTLDPISQDAGGPVGNVGTLVSSLIDFATPAGQMDNVIDVDDGALLGVAITAADTNNGGWFYSINGGITWASFGLVSTGNSLLLAADTNDRVYFQPNGTFTGVITNALTFRAWDQTKGINGNKISTSSNGGTNAFSLDTDTASLTIKAINKSYGRITIEPSGGYRIYFKGTPRQQYTIQFSSTPKPVDWQFLDTRVADSQGDLFIIDTPPKAAVMRLYRSIIP